MRQILAVLVAALLAAPALPARDNHDWANMKKVKPGTPLRVQLWSGESLGGELDAVSDSTLRLSVTDSSAPQTGWSRTLDRASIHRVSRVRHNDLPNLNRWMAGGAVAGGATGVIIGAVQDAKRGTSGRWVLGGFAGAVLGFVAAVAAVGTVAIVKTARNASHVRAIYEDGGAPPTS